MNVTSIVTGFCRAARNEGVIMACRNLASRLRIRYHETSLGIHTEAAIELPDLGIHNSECNQYIATDYDAFGEIIRQLEIDPRAHVFLDYGAGMGRAMVLAATYPFRRVVGVEISEHLTEIARKNFEECRARLKCTNIEIVTGDATSYSPPHDVSVIYFQNPFNGTVLNAALNNVRHIAENSESVFLICNLPHASGFEAQVRSVDWLILRKEFSLPGKRHCLIFSARQSV